MKQADIGFEKKTIAWKLFQESPIPTVLIDPITFKILYLNNMACKFLGFSNSIVLKKGFHELFLKHEKIKIFNKLRISIGKNSINLSDLNIVSKNKKNLPVNVSINLIRFVGKSVLIVLLSDISLLKKAQKELVSKSLKLSESVNLTKKFKLLVDSSTDAISIVSNDLSFLYANSAALKMYKITSQSQLTKKNTVLSFISGRDRKLFTDSILPKIKKSGWFGELLLKNSAGTVFPASATYFPVKDGDNNLLYFVKVEKNISIQKKFEAKLEKEDEILKSQLKELMLAVGEIRKGNFDLKVKMVKNSSISELAEAFNKMALDVSELMKLNETKSRELKNRQFVLEHNVSELNQLILELKSLDKMKTNFLATTSHELKTPITPLILQLQLLQRGDFGELKKKQLESVEMIYRNIKRLSDLINDILELSRMEGSKMELKIKQTDLNHLIVLVLQTMESKFIEKGIKIFFKKEKIPNVSIDSDKITEVFINLLDNASKFVPVNGSIWIKAIKQKDSVLVSIKDNGIGISEKDLPKLFKPFTQLHEAMRREYKGTGLGLSICKKLIQVHHGKIWVESEGKGKGTSFFFSLPA